MKADIEIAQAARLEPVDRIAERAGIPPAALEPYGRHKAKIALDWINALPPREGARLILMTAISPTPAGEGKTTTSIGLGDALARIGKRTMICLREPSMGPVFGMKGGATGGGYAQVVPMEDINLHFTGDFAAIALAHNLLSALLDNHIHHGNALGIDVRRITWPRVVDVNDRALREVTIGMGGPANGYPRQDRFDIVVASEVMAILCLASNFADLKQRLGDIVVGYTASQQPVTARDLQGDGAMAALLRDAVKPNLVQTLEGTPALIHGGPFANIAHGCSSVIATSAGMKLADYVITEAGFGADLGAEKFLDIKCRESGLRPHCAVIVATIRALKYHGGASLDSLSREDLVSLKAGLPNLLRHVSNLSEAFGLRCVVAVNHRTHDTDAEVALLGEQLAALDTPVVVAQHWAKGGEGAVDLAHAVVAAADAARPLQLLYEDELPLWEKINVIARRIYRAAQVVADKKVRNRIEQLQAAGYGHLPVCVAKTQSSFSGDPSVRGAPEGHILTVREVRLAAGARFVVMVCGEIMTMPGLPAVPAAHAISVTDDGRITGLS
ncbi:MAG: formate--tetrahydrofolate ligase [Lautropia sp.]|nr:formate--tetrahydrofolate ligase [Lautropia sp.]